MAVFGAMVKKLAGKKLKKKKEEYEKDAAENGKVKATGKMVVRNLVKIIISVMLPSILGVIFLAGAYYTVKDLFVKDTTSSYASAIGSAIGTVATSSGEEFEATEPSIKIKPGENGRYIIEYDITEEDIETLWSILKEEDYSDLTEENIKFIAALVKHGYSLEKDKIYKNKEYLQSMFLFFKAEVASQSLDLRTESEMYVNGEYNPPSFEEEGIPGVVRVNQYRINPETKETVETHLSYIPESEFEGNNTGHFTINETGNLVVANTTETTVEYNPEGYINAEDVNGTTYSTTLNPINFKPVISKFTLPFGLMTILMAHLNDEEFDRNIANTVIESSIVLALKEEETERITKTIKTYIPRTEAYYDFRYVVSYTVNSANTTTLVEDKEFDSIGQARAFLIARFGYTGMFAGGSDEWDWNGTHYKATYKNKKLTVIKTVASGSSVSEPERKEEPLKPVAGKNYTSLSEESPVNVTETITTKTYKQELEIKEVKNWFMDYNIESYTGSSETTTGEPVETIIPQEEYLGVEDREEYKNEENGFSKEPLDPEDRIMSAFRGQKEQEIIGNTPGASSFNWSITGDVYKHLENVLTKTNATTTTTTTIINNEEPEAKYRTQDSVGSFLYYFDISSSAKDNFPSASDMIKKALAENTTTVDQVNILKYLLYLYTGHKDYNVDPIDLSTLVGTIDFASFGGNGIYMFLYQFEHGNNSIPTDASGKYYKMYGDSRGNATIGMGMQWKSQVDKFNVSGTVLLSDGVTESSEPNIAEYVREKLGSHTAKLSNEEIDARGIYLDKEMVDQVVREAIDEWVRLVDNETGSLGLSEQQRFALIELCYGRGGYGLDWQGFRNAYNVAGVEKNSPEQLKKIWDEWWVKAGIDEGSAGGVLRGQDAAFETYVKGTANFSNPWQPTGMDIGQRRQCF